MGNLAAAEEALGEVQRELVRRQMGYDAALVSIDLGLLYLETGEVERLRRLASELMPIFAAKDLSKEAFACLLLYQDACQTLELTGQLGRELLRFLAEDRRCPAGPTSRVPAGGPHRGLNTPARVVGDASAREAHGRGLCKLRSGLRGIRGT